MKAWLKGGVIGGVIGVLTGLVYYFYPLSSLPYIIVQLLDYTHFPGYIVFTYESAEGFYPSFMGFVLDTAVYFLIGFIIGWIIGKIKSKKQVQPLIQK